MKNVYVIQDGYDYENSSVVAVFDTPTKAKKHLEEWKNQYKKEFNVEECVELPFGFKFGTHYRIATVLILNKNDIREFEEQQKPTVSVHPSRNELKFLRQGLCNRCGEDEDLVNEFNICVSCELEQDGEEYE